uniref:Aminopeptidase N n=1 Tax=Timema californicum TaxID=61474 RepID=A0A7R9JB37_TIMCA|nr:unnamed protein product [Timema californicum]
MHKLLIVDSGLNYLWLSEGFATYFQYFAMHKVRVENTVARQVDPNMRLDHQFLFLHHHTAFQTDSLESSHPMTNSPSGSSITQIVYNKAGSVIRMMEHILTTEVFRKGLNRYLTERYNSIAEADDLFSALNAQYIEDNSTPQIDVKTVMDTWTLQKGYPVVTVNRNYTTGSAIVSQKRFLMRKNESEADTSNSRWWVPLTFTSQASQDFLSTGPKIWMNDSQTDTTIADIGAKANQWVIFNIQETGFYRVNYDAQNWAFLAGYLNSDNFTNIHVLNRAQLLDDAFNLARAGVLNYGTALSLTKYLSRETDYIPWLYNYVLELLSNLQKTLGFEEQISDDHTTKLLRNLVLTWSCDYGHRDCISRSIDTFASAMSEGNTSSIPPDVRTVVYCNALRQGGEVEWDFLWEQYLTSEVSTEQALILGVLGCTKNETVAHKYLRKTITEDSYIRAQDISRIYPSVYNNPYGVDFAISFLANNYKEILEFNNNAVSSITNLASGIASAISSQDQLDRIRSFLSRISEDLGESGLATAEATLQSALRNLAWLEENGGVISTWVKEQNYRLPRDIVPHHYVVKLTSDLDGDTFTYDGSVDITLNVSVDTNQIILHANDLEIINTIVRKVEDEEYIVITATNLDTLRDFYYIQLEENLVAGEQYILSMVFQGHHREDMYGFYRSYYYNETGDKSWIASTQFQATSARRAFPCFDEPGFKAIFKISIARTEDRHALSNMPLLTSDEINDAGLIWDHFLETPMPISTYLIAFVVSDFVNLSSSDGFYSTWQRAGAVYQAQYSIDISPFIMKSLENFTELDYFLPKMDQVAVPDFSAGAMENWGLVTYRLERNILLVEDVTPSNYKQAIAAVIAHEFAHKWFGNLVSPVWWNHLWINEGFARYYQYFTTADVEPTWRVDDQFLVAQLHTSILADSLETAHSLTVDVGSPSVVSSIFSTITYNKGAPFYRGLFSIPSCGSCLYPICLYLVLRARSFRAKRKLIFPSVWFYRKTCPVASTIYGFRAPSVLVGTGNKTAEPDDLFAALHEQHLEDLETRATETLPVTMKTIMDTWTLQSGHPVLTVTRNYTTRTATVSQERFLLRRSESTPETSPRTWWIPLSYTSLASLDFNTTTAKEWLSDEETQKTTSDLNATSNDWVIFNIQQTGFYRVNYDAQNWALLTNYLNSESFTNIHVLNRAQLLDDAFNLARAGVLNYGTALSLTKYLSRETDYIPWYSALTGFTYLDRRIRGLSEYDHHTFKNYILGLLNHTNEVLGLTEDESDGHVTKLNRNLILTWQCNYEVSSCIDMSINEFNKLMDDPDNYKVAPDLKTVVYCNALRYGGEEELNFLWNRYLTHNVNTEQVLILGVLGCTRNETLAHRHLRKTITSDSGIRLQDISTIYSSVHNNPYGVDFAINFLSQNFREIIQFNASVSSVVSGIAGAVSSQEQLDKLEQFINDNADELGSSTTTSALNNLQTTKINLEWLNAHGSTIMTWIKQQNYRLPTHIIPYHYNVVLKPNLDDDTFQVGHRYRLHLNYKGYHREDMAGFYRSYYYKNGVKRWLASTQFQPTSARRAFPCFDEPGLKAIFKVSIGVDSGRHALANMPVESIDMNEEPGIAWYHFQETPMPISTYLIAFVVSDFTNLSSSDGFYSTWQREAAVGQAQYSIEVTPRLMTALEAYTGLEYFLPKLDQVAVPDFDAGAMENWGLITYREIYILYQERVSRAMDKQNVATIIAHELAHKWFGNLVSPKWWKYLWLNEGFATFFEYFTTASVETSWRLDHQFVPSAVQSALSSDSLQSSHPMTVDVGSPNEISAIFSTVSYSKVHPTEIRTLISPSSAVKLNTTSALANYATEAAGSVIRMIEHCLTPEIFRKGISQYVASHGNQTAEPDYLFRALQEQYENEVESPGFDVKTVLDTWSTQKGYPVITVTLGTRLLNQTTCSELYRNSTRTKWNHLDSMSKTVLDTWSTQKGYPVITVTRNYSQGQTIVRQERFLRNMSESPTDTHDYKWWVPLTYTTQSQLDFNTTTAKTWLEASQDSSLVDVSAASNEWILFNIQETGFYRVNYDARNWALLTNYLNSESFTNIHVLNRAQLLDDAFNLARAGILNYGTALSLTKYLSRETDYIPWYSALTGFNYINRRIRGMSEYDHHTFKKYILKLFEHVQGSLGYDELEIDSHTTKINRNLIMSWLCNYEVKSCTDYATREFAALMNDPDSYYISPNLKSVVYCNGLRFGGEEEWDFLWNRYLNHNVNTEQVIILGVLGCTKNETLAHRYLRKTISANSSIRSQDQYRIYSSVNNNHYGIEHSISFLEENYREIYEFNNNSTSSIVSVISGISGSISSQEEVDRLKQFISDVVAQEFGVNVATSALNSLRTAENNLVWLNTYGSTIIDLDQTTGLSTTYRNSTG